MRIRMRVRIGSVSRPYFRGDLLLIDGEDVDNRGSEPPRLLDLLNRPLLTHLTSLDTMIPS